MQKCFIPCRQHGERDFHNYQQQLIMKTSTGNQIYRRLSQLIRQCGLMQINPFIIHIACVIQPTNQSSTKVVLRIAIQSPPKSVWHISTADHLIFISLCVNQFPFAFKSHDSHVYIFLTDELSTTCKYEGTERQQGIQAGSSLL